MTGSIDLLNVGDGDAIIVSLNKDDENLIIVIDGGQQRHYQQKLRPKLQELLEENGKLAPDIVIVTHYDSDHIAGLIPLVEEYIDNIQEVWVHRSPELLMNEAKSLMELEQLRNINTYEEEGLLNEVAKFTPIEDRDKIEEKSNFIIESLGQLEEFLSHVPNDKIMHVYSGYSYTGWPEINVLGPTEEYYNELFPAYKSLAELIADEINNDDEHEVRRVFEGVEEEDPCQRLKIDRSAKLTSTNKASIIVSIDNGNKRFLFTGDAGIDSFKAIPNWETELAELHWLKIPHHGSDNNMSREIIDTMLPKYADSSGSRHQDDHVLGCISKNPRSMQNCRSTKSDGDITIPI